MATSKEHMLSEKAKSYIKKYMVYPFNKGCVKVLNEILDITDADIILSSDWKLYHNIHEMMDIFQINGVNKVPLFMTEDLSFLDQNPLAPLSYPEQRSMEINKVLDSHQINSYIVVDDLDMSRSFGERFVHCKRPNEGIKQSGIKEKCINKLLMI